VAGFTIIEVLVTMSIIAVGLVSIASLIPLASSVVREGRHLTAAAFLAEERLEQIRSARWITRPSGGAEDCVGLSDSPATAPVSRDCPTGRTGDVTFPDEAVGALTAPFESYARSVRIRSCGEVGLCPFKSDELRLVTVSVRYPSWPPVGGDATGAVRAVVLAALVTRDP
jgi:prepilin-type N-terminal cleavage/methylation domain-containing protein